MSRARGLGVVIGLAVTVLLVLALGTGCSKSDSPEASSTSGQDQAAAQAGKVIFQKELVPSGAEQVIACGEGLALILPAGVLTGTARLEVREVPEPAPMQVEGMQLLSAWNLSLGQQQEFAQPVTLEMAYDPTSLAPDEPAEAQLFHVWYMPAVKGWGFGPVEVDTERHVARFQTLHFSAHGLAVNPAARTFLGFRVTIDKGFKALPSWAIATGASTPEEYRDVVVKELTAAGKAYARSGLAKLPEKPVEVIIGSWGLEETSQWSLVSGNIYIIADYEDLNELKHDCAHELFHAIQNQFLNVGSMLAFRWLFEPTADLAVEALVFPGLGHAGGGIDEAFLSRSLAYDPNSKDRHKYHAMHLFKHMCRSGAAALATADPTVDEASYFARLWNASAAAAKTSGLGLQNALDASLKSMHGDEHGLFQAYSDFALYFLFDSTSPMPKSSTGKMLPNVAEESLILDADPDVEAMHTFSFGSSEQFSARVWAIRAHLPDKAPGRVLSVAVDGELPSAMRVYVVHLPDNVRPAGGVKPDAAFINRALNYRPAAVYMKQNDALYVVAIWSSFVEDSVSVKVQAIPVEITSITPSAAAVGEEVVIKGRGFGPDPLLASGRLLMGKRDIISAKTSWTDTEIRLNVPSGALPEPFRVIVNDERSNAMPFQVIVPPWPDGLYELRHGTMDKVSLPNPLLQISGGEVTVLHERSRQKCGQGTVGAAKNRTKWTDPIYEWNVEFTHEYKNAAGPVKLSLKIVGGDMQLTGTAAMTTGMVPVDVWAYLVPTK